MTILKSNECVNGIILVKKFIFLCYLDVEFLDEV